jgi:hypothetical protein
MTKSEILARVGDLTGQITNNYPTELDNIYGRILNKLIMQYNWNFNIDKAVLVVVTSDNSYHPDYQYQFTLPTNFGRLKDIFCNNTLMNEIDFEIMNGFMLINEPVVKIFYYKNSITMTTFDSIFGELLAVEIAITYCEKIGRIQDLEKLLSFKQEALQLSKDLQAKNNKFKYFNLYRLDRARYR